MVELRASICSIWREIITTKGLIYNIDPFINFNYNNNRHSIKTRHLSVLNDNLNNGVDVGQARHQKLIILIINGKKISKNMICD